MHTCLHACLSVDCEHDWCPQRPEEENRSPETEVLDGSEAPRRSWESNPGLSEHQSMLLITELSLKPWGFVWLPKYSACSFFLPCRIAPLSISLLSKNDIFRFCHKIVDFHMAFLYSSCFGYPLASLSVPSFFCFLLQPFPSPLSYYLPSTSPLP